MANDLDLNGIIDRDGVRKRERKKLEQSLTFRDYIELVKKDPLIAQNAPSRLLEIGLQAGVEDIPEVERWLGVEKRYNLISKKLFGVEKPTAEFFSWLRAGAARLSTGKQILLLVGPTASGKSTFTHLWKRALEGYRLRQVFQVKGCPMFQEPLLLLPRYLRTEFEEKLGIKIEGDLCPPCRAMLREKFTDQDGTIRWWDVPVETFTFSIQGSRGIGSFEPSDEKSSDISQIVGRENIQITSTKGPDHPLAFTLSGEAEKSNRGVLELREMIKAQQEILWVFISIAEEKEVKVIGSNFPHISVDETAIAHCNLTEFKKFSGNQSNEALHDRIFVIPFPYPIRVRDEMRVYNKLIRTESDFSQLKNCHIAPGTLELAAIFAVLTRLAPSASDLDPLTKLKIYNGDRALTELSNKEKEPVDLRTLLQEGQADADISKREGMFGISSRDVLAALNTALVKEGEGGCLTPLRAIRALRDVFDHRMGYTPEEVDRFKTLLSAGEEGHVMGEYRTFIINTVSRAFLRAYNDLAIELYAKYYREANLARNQKRKFIRGQVLDIARDEITGKPKEPDMKLLKSVETHIPISEQEADTFRGEILEFGGMILAKLERGEKLTEADFNYYPPLARAVEKKLLHDSRASLTLVLASDKPKGEEEKKRTDDLYTALTNPASGKDEDHHCEICATEAVERAREFLGA